MTEQEKNDFRSLCDYIKKNILMYGDDKAFPKSMAIRLKGIAYGQHIINGKTEEKRIIYPYNVILATVIMNKGKMLYGIGATQFKNEQHLVNYIAKIIELNINDTVDMINRRRKTKEQAKDIKKDVSTHNIEHRYIQKSRIIEEKEHSEDKNIDDEYSMDKILAGLW